MTVKIQGWDLALNHSAIVELTDGELTDFWYITSIAGSAARSKTHGARLVLSKSKDRQQKAMFRLAWIQAFLGNILYRTRPDYVGIEDYALRAEQGAHYMGEVGGVARCLCWDQRVKMRLHDPVSVKMFVAHDGTCQKDQVERAVKERWGVDFSEYNPPPPKPTAKNPTPKQNRVTSEDLADAYAIAQMVWIEVQLRSGRVRLQDMHPKEVRVFNRITKSYPVSLLDREWLHHDS